MDIPTIEPQIWLLLYVDLGNCQLLGKRHAKLKDMLKICARGQYRISLCFMLSEHTTILESTLPSEQNAPQCFCFGIKDHDITRPFHKTLILLLSRNQSPCAGIWRGWLYFWCGAHTRVVFPTYSYLSCTTICTGSIQRKHELRTTHYFT